MKYIKSTKGPLRVNVGNVTFEQGVPQNVRNEIAETALHEDFVAEFGFEETSKEDLEKIERAEAEKAKAESGEGE